MSVPTKELLSAFPIDQLFLIISAGLLVILFFPLDIFAMDFSEIILNPGLNLLEFIVDNYNPFALIQYLSDFPEGLIKIFLVSLVPGLFIFTMQDVFSKINGKIPISCKKKFRPKIKKPKSKKEKMIQTQESIKYNFWIRKNGLYKYINSLWSLHCVTIGWLFALELLLLIYIIIFIFAIPFNLSNFSILIPYVFWTFIILIIGLFSYGIHVASYAYYRKRSSKLLEYFKFEIKQEKKKMNK